MAKPPVSKKSPPHKARKSGNGKPPNGRQQKAAAAKPAAVNKTGRPSGKPAVKPPDPVPVNDKKPRQPTELEGKLLHLISEEMAIEEAELTPNASFKGDLHLDEIDVVELLMHAEEAFNVHPFTEADWDVCTTVADYLQMVSKRVEAKRSRKRV